MIDLSLGNNVVLNDAVSAFIQEIDILFNTVNTELIGDTEFGTNFQYFLWELQPNEQEIENYVRLKINQTFFSQIFRTDIKSERLEGTENNIYLIQIIIHQKNDEDIKKTYIFK